MLTRHIFKIRGLLWVVVTLYSVQASLVFYAMNTSSLWFSIPVLGSLVALMFTPVCAKSHDGTETGTSENTSGDNYADIR